VFLEPEEKNDLCHGKTKDHPMAGPKHHEWPGTVSFRSMNRRDYRGETNDARHCLDRKICEARPVRPRPHGNCPGRGMPCDNSDWRGRVPASVRTRRAGSKSANRNGESVNTSRER
jgi:hypothetical protein